MQVELKTDQIDASEVWTGDTMPEPYSPPGVGIQSVPSAARGGANQRKRNWCSGLFILTSGQNRIFPLDGASGEWVTIQTFPSSLVTSSVIEDGVYRVIAPSQFYQFRRNGDTCVVVNNDTVNRHFIVTVSDYESRPNSSS